MLLSAFLLCRFFLSGVDLLGAIYTKTRDALRTNLRNGHPDLENIIIEFVYVLH